MKTIDKKAIMNAIEKVLGGEKNVDPSLLSSLVDEVKGDTKLYDLTRIFKKINVNNRTEAALFWVEHKH